MTIGGPGPDWSERMAFALDVARSAGDETMRWFQNATLVAEGKSDGSPVTQADRAAERLVRDRIAAAYPDDGIIGEEFPSDASPTADAGGWTWVVDPIDGTRSFVQGVPMFGTMLACLEGGEPRIGVIVLPALNECVAAETGKGCWWWRGGGAPVRARVSGQERVRGAVVLTTSLEYFREDRERRAWDGIDRAGAITRGWSDCYGIVLLATGRADAVVEPLVKVWDIASVPTIVTEAGGAWSDLRGREDLDSGSLIATNGRLQGAIVGAMGSGG